MGRPHDGEAQRVAEIRTNIPERLDNLPWSGWHVKVIVGLGITWILDGLEVTIVGSIGSRLQDRTTLGLSASDVGESATAYLIGAVIGALGFGYLTDRFGRKKLFLVTLTWYLAATLLTAGSWNFASFAFFRFLTGLGIGGEYSAINSTIDELIPAKRRGAVDLGINGTFWFGAILGSAASLVLLNPHFVDQQYGWRIAFGIGAVIAVAILFLRGSIPESPRWLLGHGRAAEAERVLAGIEGHVRASTRAAVPRAPEATLVIDPDRRHSLGDVWHAMVRTFPERTVVAFALMISQAFLYNAIFFTESLVLSSFFGVPPQDVGYYIFPFAVGNLAGPLLLGPLFDRIGRKAMISTTYGLSAALLLGTGLLFVHGLLDARTIALCWSIVFFFASAGASSAYLTVSETFPVEIRAMAIAIVYGVGTLAGGALAPTVFAALIATASRERVFEGYIGAAVLMFGAAAIELIYGVEAAGRRLEDVAAPLAARSNV
jgi:MFS family permease